MGLSGLTSFAENFVCPGSAWGKILDHLNDRQLNDIGYDERYIALHKQGNNDQ